MIQLSKCRRNAKYDTSLFRVVVQERDKLKGNQNHFDGSEFQHV